MLAAAHPTALSCKFFFSDEDQQFFAGIFAFFSKLAIFDDMSF